jgi:hypothetical protein
VVTQLEAGEKLLLIVLFALHNSRYESKKLDWSSLRMFINSCATATHAMPQRRFSLREYFFSYG